MFSILCVNLCYNNIKGFIKNISIINICKYSEKIVKFFCDKNIIYTNYWMDIENYLISNNFSALLIFSFNISPNIFAYT